MLQSVDQRERDTKTWNKNKRKKLAFYIDICEEEKCIVFYESGYQRVRRWKSSTLKDESTYPFMADLQCRHKQTEKLENKIRARKCKE